MASSAVHPGIMAAINQSIAPAFNFNQVVQNQSALQMQIAALSGSHKPNQSRKPTRYIKSPSQCSSHSILSHPSSKDTAGARTITADAGPNRSTAAVDIKEAARDGAEEGEEDVSVVPLLQR